MKMPKENIDISMFAPCGMNCKVCYKHCYHRKPCAGCLSGDKGKPEHCRKCKIKNCIKEKARTYCFECSEYPCKLIKNLERSYNERYQASLIENSCFVQKYGLDCFMEQQKEKYTCPRGCLQTQAIQTRIAARRETAKKESARFSYLVEKRR